GETQCPIGWRVEGPPDGPPAGIARVEGLIVLFGCVGGDSADGPGITGKRNSVGKQIVGWIGNDVGYLFADRGRNISRNVFSGDVDPIQSLAQTKSVGPIGRAVGLIIMSLDIEHHALDAGSIQLRVIGSARNSD